MIDAVILGGALDRGEILHVSNDANQLFIAPRIGADCAERVVRVVIALRTSFHSLRIAD